MISPPHGEDRHLHVAPVRRELVHRRFELRAKCPRVWTSGDTPIEERGNNRVRLAKLRSLAGRVLTYSDLKAITDDIADARVYGGIHFRFDQDAGERQGHAVGQYVYNNLLRKLSE